MSVVRRIVSNTGPLISLEKLNNGYEFIRKLYDEVLIPPIVLEEVASDHFSTPTDYLHYYGITDLIQVRPVSSAFEKPEFNRIHNGEKQAIQLALELKLPLLIEETIGREIADELGIHFSGIAGQILKAFREKIIPLTEAQDKLVELFQGGRINRRIYDLLLDQLKRFENP